jgi:hypothetical protein
MPPSIGSITAALAACDLAKDDLNYAAIAREFQVDRTTLSKRHRGETQSREAFLSKSCQRLNNSQEETLISIINRYTSRNIPPTCQMVTNFAEEIIESCVGKNWTSNFIRRHSDKLKSVYLRHIDRQRVKSEYLPSYEYFFHLVSLFIIIFSCGLVIGG